MSSAAVKDGVGREGGGRERPQNGGIQASLHQPLPSGAATESDLSGWGRGKRSRMFLSSGLF